MKIYLRLTLILICIAVTVPCMLCGCHGTLVSDSDADISSDIATNDMGVENALNEFIMPENFDTEKTHTITFWAKNDTNVNQTEIYKQAIREFESLYPNVKVVLQLYNDYGKIYNDVITNIPTNTTPNVCITYPDHIATYLTGKNTVVSLESLLENSKYGLGGSEVKFDSPSKNEVVPEFLEECIVNGKYHALPYMRSTEACYINKDFVEKLGYTIPDVLTWDFIWEVSEAAMAKDENGNFTVNGQKIMIPFIYKSTDNMMIQMTKQLESGYSTDDGKVLLFNDKTKELLYTIYEHAKTRSFSTFKISSYPGNFFNAGQCIFAIDSTAGATWIGSNAPLIDISKENLVSFETVVKPIPQFDVENPKMISQGPSMCIFNKEDPQEVLASWLFMQYLLSDHIQISYSQTEGYVPVTSRAQNSDVYKEYLSRKGEDNNLYYDVKISAAELLINNTENTFITPVYNGSASLRNAAGQLIEEVAKSARRNEKIDDAYINELYKTIKSRYKLETIEGGLPAISIWFLAIIAIVWAILIGYFVISMIRKRKNTVE